jgi:hypothetical protein
LKPFTTIIVLTHNALHHTKRMFETIQITADADHAVVMVDNASTDETPGYLYSLVTAQQIHAAALLRENTFFARGNNIGFTMRPGQTTHVLLLNNDVVFRDPAWLSRLHQAAGDGMAGYGLVSGPDRPDGFCLLVPARVYAAHGLDEQYPWWYSVSALTAKAMADGVEVTAVRNYGRYLHHAWGGSGPLPNGMKTPPPPGLAGWFSKSTRIVEE